MTTTQDQSTAINTAWQARHDDSDGWLHQWRAGALAQFGQSGFPTRRQEDWKYTDVGPIAARYADWLTRPAGETGAQPELLKISAAESLVFVNGRFAPDYSSTSNPAVLAGQLGELTARQPELESRLGELALPAHSGFVALNTAFAEDAAVIYLPDNTELEPIVHLHFTSQDAEQGVQPRVLVVAGRNSQATIVEHHANAGQTISNAVTELHCGENSRINWLKLQEDSRESWHVAIQKAHLEANARLQVTQIDIGAALARNELQIRLAGSGAHAECKGLLLGAGKQHVDSRITVEHAAPSTTSRERYRSILADTARGVFNGRILVTPEAQKTAAELTNRNLLLDSGAEINSKPELEIYADDVKCAHGSTTGQLDANSLFYLLSRGIGAQQARRILVRAFAAELLSDIEVTALAEHVQDALLATDAGDGDANG